MKKATKAALYVMADAIIAKKKYTGWMRPQVLTILYEQMDYWHGQLKYSEEGSLDQIRSSMGLN